MFSSIESVKTQVVAGTFFTFILKSSLDETIDVKLFKSLPDNDSPRKVTYEVSYAILIRHGETNFYKYAMRIRKRTELVCTQRKFHGHVFM